MKMTLALSRTAVNYTYGHISRRAMGGPRRNNNETELSWESFSNLAEATVPGL